MVVFGNYPFPLFIRQEEITSLIEESISRFLLLNGIFFPFLGILLVLRNAAQGLGFGILAMGAGVFEMIARSVVAFCFVSAFGFIAICYANPAAWIAACIILTPIYLYSLKQVKRCYLTALMNSNFNFCLFFIFHLLHIQTLLHGAPKAHVPVYL